jgi:type I restriction enzyme S subunit
MEPKIRFKGFTGVWKETKFDTLAKIRRGLTYSPSNITAKGVRVLRSSNINEDTFVTSEDDVFVEETCVNIPLANDGDILITAANGSPRLVGKHAVIETNGSTMVPGGFMVLAMTDEPYFLNTCMSSPWYKTFLKTGVAGGNGAIGNLNKTALSDSVFFIPSNKADRDSLASYFQHLDSLIQSTTKKIESLKQVKAASLQSMFPQEGETTPRVRFKGFEGDWRILPLSTFAKKSIERNEAMEYNVTLTNSAEFGVINQREFFDHDISNDDNINGYYVVHNDAFVYNPRVSTFAPVGPINRNQLGYSGIMSPLYLIFNVEGINKDFLSYFFKTKLWHNYMKLEGNTGARFDRLAISDTQFFKMPIYVPEQEEQQQIASFFNSLDSQITLQTKRLEKLKQIKSACLDNMFV